MDLVAEAGFDSAYSFVYSPRPGTPAANLRDNVPAEEKQRRLHILQNRIRAQDAEFMRRLVGTTQTVLVEKPSVRGQGRMAGRRETNRMVNFEGPETLIGQLVDVTITETQPNSLRGRQVLA